MAIDVEAQREAVFEEGAREEVKIGGEVFGGVDACADAAAAAVVEHVEEREQRAVRPPAVRGGVELPERADLAALPAADGGAWLGRGLFGGEAVGEGEAADGGRIELVIEAAFDLAGGGAVAGRRAGREQLAQQRLDLDRPGCSVIAAGDAGQPARGLATRAGAEVVGVELVEASASDAEFGGGGRGAQLIGAEGGKDFADEGWSDTVGELLAVFFIARKMQGHRRDGEGVSAARRFEIGRAHV